VDARVVIQSEDFNVAQIYAGLRAESGSDAGAIVTFVGLVRDRNAVAGDGSEVSTLTLEHYPGMTEQSIAAILDEAQQRWPVPWMRVLHRVGELQPSEQIVLVMVGSAHRDAAFAAAEFIMDYLKTKAVLWKRELTREGEVWLEPTAQDAERTKNWQQN
jgi:molybdopterin synthase catalytic subunit